MFSNLVDNYSTFYTGASNVKWGQNNEKMPTMFTTSKLHQLGECVCIHY